MGGLEAKERLISGSLVCWWLEKEDPNSEIIKYSFDDVDIAGGVNSLDGLRV